MPLKITPSKRFLLIVLLAVGGFISAHSLVGLFFLCFKPERFVSDWSNGPKDFLPYVLAEFFVGILFLVICFLVNRKWKSPEKK